MYKIQGVFVWSLDLWSYALFSQMKWLKEVAAGIWWKSRFRCCFPSSSDKKLWIQKAAHHQNIDWLGYIIKQFIYFYIYLFLYFSFSKFLYFIFLHLFISIFLYFSTCIFLYFDELISLVYPPLTGLLAPKELL